MKRFFGMMPSEEIQKEKYYKDDNGLRIMIQAGIHGWTIVYADSSTNYKDVNDTTDKNFNAAYNLAVDKLGSLTELQE